MKRRITIIAGTAVLVAAMAVVSVFTLTNTKGNDKGRNADSPQQIQAAGETLEKADDQEKMPLDENTIYTDKDNNTYYINNDNGYLELVIADATGDDMISAQKAFSDEEIISSAKEYVMKWYKDYEPDRFEWSIEEDTEYTRRVYMRQMSDGKEVGTIAAMTYSQDGKLVSGSFWFDAVLTEKQIAGAISEERALELAGKILNDRYNTSSDKFNKIMVDTNTHSGRNYWYITYVADNDELVSGYVIEIDKITGEEGNISELR